MIEYRGKTPRRKNMVNTIIKNRRAVRKFTADSVSDDEIKNLIEASQTSPCGMHQPDVMNLVVVKDKELRAEIEKATGNSCYGAPVLFLINTKKDNMFGERDASAAAENIMLEATDMGLGSVYVMGGAVKLNNFADIQKELGIAQDFETTVIVPVGKIAEEPAKEDRTSRYQVTIY